MAPRMGTTLYQISAGEFSPPERTSVVMMMAKTLPMTRFPERSIFFVFLKRKYIPPIMTVPSTSGRYRELRSELVTSNDKLRRVKKAVKLIKTKLRARLNISGFERGKSDGMKRSKNELRFILKISGFQSKS